LLACLLSRKGHFPPRLVLGRVTNSCIRSSIQTQTPPSDTFPSAHLFSSLYRKLRLPDRTFSRPSSLFSFCAPLSHIFQASPVRPNFLESGRAACIGVPAPSTPPHSTTLDYLDGTTSHNPSTYLPQQNRGRIHIRRLDHCRSLCRSHRELEELEFSLCSLALVRGAEPSYRGHGHATGFGQLQRLCMFISFSQTTLGLCNLLANNYV